MTRNLCYFLAITLCLFLFAAQAQVKTPASSRIDTTGYGRIIDHLLDSATKVRYDNYDNVTRLLDSCYRYIEWSGHKKRHCRYLGIKGIVEINNGRVEHGRSLLVEAKAIAAAGGWRKYESQITNAIGSSNLNSGDFESALVCYLAHLKYATETKDTTELVNAHANVGLSYYKLGDARKALYFYSIILRQFRKFAAEATLARVYPNVSLAYLMLNEFDSALLFVNKGYPFCATAGDHISYHFVLGRYYETVQKWKQADVSFSKALKFARAKGDIVREAECLIGLGKCNLMLHKFNKSFACLNTAQLIAEQNSLKSVLQAVFKTWIEYHSKNLNYVARILAQKRYAELAEVTDDVSILNKMHQIQTRYKEEHRQLRIAKQAELLALKNAKLQARQFVFYLTSCLLALLGLVVLLLVYFVRLSRKANEILELKVTQRTHKLEEQFLIEANLLNRELQEEQSLMIDFLSLRNSISGCVYVIQAGTQPHELDRFQMISRFIGQLNSELCNCHTKAECESSFYFD